MMQKDDTDARVSMMPSMYTLTLCYALRRAVVDYWMEIEDLYLGEAKAGCAFCDGCENASTQIVVGGIVWQIDLVEARMRGRQDL